MVKFVNYFYNRKEIKNENQTETFEHFTNEDDESLADEIDSNKEDDIEEEEVEEDEDEDEDKKEEEDEDEDKKEEDIKPIRSTKQTKPKVKKNLKSSQITKTKNASKGKINIKLYASLLE